MKILDILVKQCRKPAGLLGKIMLKIMERADAGFNSWVLSYIDVSMKNILDIGCGGGKTLKKISNKCYESTVFGIDYSFEAVKVAKKLNRKKESTGIIKICQGNVMDLPYENNVFDCITAIRTHYFWNDVERAFKEIYRTLIENGKLVVLTEKFKVKYHMTQYNSSLSLKLLMESIGFLEIQIFEKDQSFCIIAIK